MSDRTVIQSPGLERQPTTEELMRRYAQLFPPQPEPLKLYTVQEAAKILGITVRHTHLLVKHGRVTAYRLGRTKRPRIRLSMEQIRDFLVVPEVAGERGRLESRAEHGATVLESPQSGRESLKEAKALLDERFGKGGKRRRK